MPIESTIATSNPSSSIQNNVTSQYAVNNVSQPQIQPQTHLQAIPANMAAPSVLPVPSQTNSGNSTISTVANSQTNVGPAQQNSIYLSIACGDEKTRHRFCLVVQMMCSLLQKNGQSADAINQFTERFKYLKEQADLSSQNEHLFLETLSNFGDKLYLKNKSNSQIKTSSNSIMIQSGIQNTPNTINSQPNDLERSNLNLSETTINSQKHPLALQISRKRRASSRPIRCGSCEGCVNHNRTRDCRACRNCLDQKRYGGPGKLKKACLKRVCMMSSSSNSVVAIGGQPSATSNTPQQSPPSSLTSTTVSSIVSGVLTNNLPLDVPLPQHPMPISSLNGSLTTSAPISSSLVGQIKRVELQVHHQPQQQQQRHIMTQQQTNALINNIQQPINNITSINNNSVHATHPGVSIGAMQQPAIGQGPQVLINILNI